MRRFVQVLSLSLAMVALTTAQAVAAPPAKSVRKYVPPSKTPDWSKMTVIDSGKIEAVLRGDLVMLDDDRRFRLDNILIPPYEDPLAAIVLQKAFLGKAVTVYAYPPSGESDQTAKDKYGVPLTHIITKKGSVWMQAYLVSRGMAWAYSSSSGNGMLEPLKIAETKAREAKVGLWQGSANGIKSPDEVGSYVGTYQIVQGKIVSVSNAEGKAQDIYFNFTKDWKTGFSVALPGYFPTWYPYKNDPGYTKYQDPYAWKGRKVRVRGWVRYENGKPVIHVDNRHQINVLAQSRK